MWAAADRLLFMSRRELAQELRQMANLVTEKDHLINDLKEALEEARESR